MAHGRVHDDLFKTRSKTKKYYFENFEKTTYNAKERYGPLVIILKRLHIMPKSAMDRLSLF